MKEAELDLEKKDRKERRKKCMTGVSKLNP
jgi:hypothetical protein